jgi:predicted permease
METLWQDVRYGLRLLAKSPGFTAVAVLTLALGMGANTAIFSVINAVLLQSLPFRNPERLVQIRGTVGMERNASISYQDFLDGRTQSRSFEQMAAYTDAEFILNGADRSERLYGELVSEDYFPVLGVAPLLGRSFLPEENQVPRARAVTMIGYGLWQRAYGSDPEIIGKSIPLNGADYTIVGVMPRGFVGFSDKAEVWIPIMMRDVAWPQTAKFDFLHARDIHWLQALGRLRTGVSLKEAQAEMGGLATRLGENYPAADKDRGFSLRYAKDAYVGRSRKPLLTLLGAVGFVLLIACVNVTNLILARMTAREREFAVRMALGAPRSRIVRQLVTECLLLALIGAAAGLVLTIGSMSALASLLPVSFPSYALPRVDRHVLLFTYLLAGLTSLLLVLPPARAAARKDFQESLKEGVKGSAGTRGRRLNAFLVISEVALAMILLAGAGLLLKSLARLVTGDTGFRPDRLLTMRFPVPDRPYVADGRHRFGPRLAEHVASLPGVESAAVTFIDPFVWGGFQRGFTLEDGPKLSPTEQDSVTYQEVGPNYFQTMGISLRRGREFTMQDSLDAPRVLIVGESFARHFWPGQNPIGKRLKYGPADSSNPWMEVVGVAGNVKFRSLRQDPAESPVLYGPLLQSEVIENMSLIVRTKTDPGAMIPVLRQEIQRYDAAVPVYSMATLGERMRESSAETRSYALLLALFAFLALLLCAIGIYGVIGFWVTQRTHEIGIRIALGAARSDVFRLVTAEGMRLAVLGLGLGLAASLVVTRALASLLYEVRAFDPSVFAAMAVLLGSVALLACYIPARRAMQVDPIVALRYE